MQNLLDGKVALVTAGANGIGRGAALALADMGADIAICDIDVANGEGLCEELSRKGRRGLFIPTDYLDPVQARAGVQKAVDHFGALDILVNNAGGVRRRPLADQSPENIQRVLNLNLMSYIATTQAAARSLRDHGAIVNVASTEALRAAPGFSVYSIAKAGMTQFTKTMALELSPRGIRVNCIAPDNIRTPGLAQFIPEEVANAEETNRHVPLGRMASIEEAGRVIAFLASPHASFITGVTIPVDGGITAASGWRRDAAGEWVV